eukprot:641629_1
MAAPQYHSTTSLVPRNIRNFDDLHAIRNALTSRWGDFDFQDLSITWPDNYLATHSFPWPTQTKRSNANSIEEHEGLDFQPKTADCDDTKESKLQKSKKEPPMFSAIQSMEAMINIKGSPLQRSLIALESELTWKNAKHNISRQCHHKDCLKKAPGSYPKNGSENEKRMCKELKRDYQQLCDAIKIPDNQQAFDKRNRYPRNYFSVAMAQLLYCRQTISRVNTTSFDAKSKQTTEQLQKTVETIMELLIVARQTLNDFWVAFFEFLIKTIQELGITMDHFTGSPAAFNHWITSHSCYVFGLYSAIVALFAAFGYLIIFGESGTGVKKIGACGAIGMAVGGMLGGPAGALAGGLLGGGIGTLVFL